MAFRNFHIENKAGKGRIALIGEISWWKNRSEEFTRMIDNLLNEGVSDLDVYLNSPGGDMFHANEIVNQLERFAGTKSLTIGAIAASAGFTIALSFPKENTSCYSNTLGMYHNPSGFIGVSRMSDFDSNKKLYQDLRSDVVKRIAQRTGLSEEKVSENMDNTTWLNSTELKKLNVVGEVLDAKDKMPTGTKNNLKNLGLDLPQFANEIDEADMEELSKVFKKSKEVIAEALQETKNQNTNKNQSETMKDIAKQLGLPENATADQITSAISALQNRAKFGDEALVNLAISKGIKKENAEKSVANNFEGTLELINGIETPPANDETEDGDDGDGKRTPSNVRPSDLLEQLKNGLQLNNAGAKKWEDYTQAELDELEKKEPAKFEQLFNASLGTVNNPKF